MTSAAMPMQDQARRLVRRFGEAFNSRNLDLLDDIMAPDFERHCEASPWTDVRSREQFKQFLRADFTGVPDSTMVPLVLVAEGDYVAFFNRYTGTQTGQWGPVPPTGKRVEFDVAGVFRIANGKLAELWVTWDNATIMGQLGVSAV